MADPKGMYGVKVTHENGDTGYLAFRAAKALYDGVAAGLGLTKLESAAEQSKAMIIPAAMYLQRLGITYEKSATDKRTGSLWCAREKFEENLSNPPATYRTFTVVKAFQPLDTNRS